MKARDYLKKPYARRLVPDEDGGYVATIQEFPGCIAEGDTANEALANLESAAESWIEALREGGQDVPEPVALHGYSGKIALRLPRGVHKQAAELAASEGTSVNQLLIAAIANYLGGKQAFSQLAHQLSTGLGLIAVQINLNKYTLPSDVRLRKTLTAGDPGMTFPVDGLQIPNLVIKNFKATTGARNG
jgi:predicted RNase H-like HicB family nuclease